MRIDLVTLFPEMFAGIFDVSIIGRARAAGAVTIQLHNPRDHTRDKHHVVDDYAYGGGPGMVMKPEPIFECVEALRSEGAPSGRVVLLTPQGRILDQAIVRELAGADRLIIICGHYEGVDERVRESLADVEISVGDYVLSGGEPAAIVLVDAIVRQLPGVLGSEQSLAEESHAQGLLEYPQYTRPEEYHGMRVPAVLLSGHHRQIEKWRREQMILRTAHRRPDMLAKASLTSSERRLASRALASAGGVPSIDAQVHRIELPAADFQRCVAYYASIFEHPGQQTGPGRHHFDCGGVVLAIVDPAVDQVAAGPEPRAGDVCFAVPDVKAIHARVKAAGGAWVEGRIKRRAWGERSFYARDPHGNAICFVDERTALPGRRSAE